MGLRIALIACLVLLVAPVAHAAPLRPMVQRTGFFETDGLRYAYWGDLGATTLTVLDTHTGRRRVVRKPATCVTRPRVGGELPTGGWITLSCDEADGSLNYFSVRLATGATKLYDNGHAWVGTYRDDQPHGCRRVSRLAWQDASPIVPRWDAGSLVADLQVPRGDDRQEQLRLLRCGRPDVVLHRGRSRGATVSGGRISWHTGLDATIPADVDYRRSSSRDALWLYDPRTGRRRSWKLPWGPDLSVIGFGRGRAHVGLSWHTANNVFWAAALSRGCTEYDCGPTGWRVYRAPIA